MVLFAANILKLNVTCDWPTSAATIHAVCHVVKVEWEWWIWWGWQFSVSGYSKIFKSIQIKFSFSISITKGTVHYTTHHHLHRTERAGLESAKRFIPSWKRIKQEGCAQIWPQSHSCWWTWGRVELISDDCTSLLFKTNIHGILVAHSGRQIHWTWKKRCHERSNTI